MLNLFLAFWACAASAETRVSGPADYLPPSAAQLQWLQPPSPSQMRWLQSPAEIRRQEANPPPPAQGRRHRGHGEPFSGPVYSSVVYIQAPAPAPAPAAYPEPAYPVQEAPESEPYFPPPGFMAPVFEPPAAPARVEPAAAAFAPAESRLGRREFIWDLRRIPLPAFDDRGVPISEKPAVRPPDLRLLLEDPVAAGRLDRLRAEETAPGVHRWHYDSGMRYSHYVDNWGAHWFGFYAGPEFFWIRSRAGRWWWFDAANGRWDYWRDGSWWWQDPPR